MLLLLVKVKKCSVFFHDFKFEKYKNSFFIDKNLETQVKQIKNTKFTAIKANYTHFAIILCKNNEIGPWARGFQFCFKKKKQLENVFFRHAFSFFLLQIEVQKMCATIPKTSKYLIFFNVWEHKRSNSSIFLTFENHLLYPLFFQTDGSAAMSDQNDSEQRAQRPWAAKIEK